jgi:AcrR family transcriptional regulator
VEERVAQIKQQRTRYAPGAATLEEIVRAAEHVLVKKGHAALTLRAVAEECDLQLGNLTYYFPTKQALVKALRESLVAQYASDMAQIELRSGADPEAMLTNLMFHWMRENYTRRTSRLYVELWSMANNDSEFRNWFNKNAYVNSRKKFRSIFKRINPELKENELSGLALFAISMMEGIMVLANADKPDSVHMPVISTYAVRVVLHLVKSPSGNEGAALAARWRDLGPVRSSK